MEYFGEENLNENLLIAFAQFEERQKEFERARMIYQWGLEHVPSTRSGDIFKCLTLHEKKFGERVRIENVIVSKRRHQYEQVRNFTSNFIHTVLFQQVSENPFNYDAWFDYIRLLMNENVDRAEVEDCFERAIANVPPYMVRFTIPAKLDAPDNSSLTQSRQVMTLVAKQRFRKCYQNSRLAAYISDANEFSFFSVLTE